MTLETFQQRFWRFAATVLLVSLVTFIDFRLQFNASTAGFTYILLVLGLALRMGRSESILASLVSMLAYNVYFLPPIGKLTIADPQNWVALVAFLVGGGEMGERTRAFDWLKSPQAGGRRSSGALWSLGRSTNGLRSLGCSTSCGCPRPQ